MRVSNKIIIVVIALIILSVVYHHAPTIAAQIPTGQDVGSLETLTEDIKKDEAITKKITTEKKKPVIEEERGVIPQAPSEKVEVPETKVLITKIEVTGPKILMEKEIQVIVSQYEGKELSLSDFRDVADSITADLRKKGYVTSIAYLPPQKIENNTLEIDVAEGRVGNINITGNKYFRTKLLLRYIRLKSGDLFDYDKLREDISYINQHPDRNARVVLARGEERGETDINIDVKDRLPIHVTAGYSNYNSDYLDRNKYSVEFKLDNVFGFDDIASAEVQLGEAGRYQLYSGRYIAPLTRNLKLGASYIHIDQALGGSVATLKIKGKGDIVSLYLPYKLIDTDNFDMSISPAFDYKEIDNEILGLVISQDNMRVAKMGVDLDIMDRFNGRTIIAQSFDYGIKDFMGGLRKKDPKASRVGAGGTFFKSVTNAARIQSLPASTSLMLRGSMQLTAYNLVSSEQFVLGGITTVRGYPNAEQAGDNGYSASAELYVPCYFIPKKLKIPHTETTFYDAIRVLGFFDWGLVTNHNPQVGETKREDIYSVGPAVRFNIPNKLSVAFDYGFALGKRPSDGSKSRGYIEVKLFF